MDEVLAKEQKVKRGIYIHLSLDGEDLKNPDDEDIGVHVLENDVPGDSAVLLVEELVKAELNKLYVIDALVSIDETKSELSELATLAFRMGREFERKHPYKKPVKKHGDDLHPYREGSMV